MHPSIENQTPFNFAPLTVTEEDGRPLLVPIVKATFAIGEGGALELGEEQRPVDFAGEYHGEPGASSVRNEPETAFAKPATDVVLVGSAHANRRGTTELEVAFSVGPVSASALVSGNRHWVKRMVGSSISEPEPFATMPLVWERAFGGWDRSPEDEDRHTFDPRNPVGVGHRGSGSRFVEGAPLPNIEEQRNRQTRYKSRVPAAGFGFTCPHWEPRSGLGGTYDESWSRDRSPLLPHDFDRRFFNAAAPGLIAPYHLRGDETVQVLNASEEGHLTFPLPGVAAPEIVVGMRVGGDVTLVAPLDTIIVDTDARELVLLWRSAVVLRDGPLDVRDLKITAANAPEAPAPPDAAPDNIVPLFGEASA